MTKKVIVLYEAGAKTLSRKKMINWFMFLVLPFFFKKQILYFIMILDSVAILALL